MSDYVLHVWLSGKIGLSEILQGFYHLNFEHILGPNSRSNLDSCPRKAQN